MNQYDILLVDGVRMNLYGVLSVLLHVAFLASFGREFAWFATHHEASSQLDSQRGANHKASALDAYHLCYAFALVEFVQFVDHYLQAFGILVQRADVLELYARDRKVRHIAQVFQ